MRRPDSTSTGSQPQEPLASREEGLRSREAAVAARELGVTDREAAALDREDSASLREEALRAREEAARTRVELEALTEQLRDANAHLVLANVRAQTLVEEARRLAAIVESSDDAILSETLDGTVTSWNAGAERMYGYSAEEMIGANLAILVPPDRSDELQAAFDRVKRGEATERLETVRVRKDGTRIDVALTISPVRDEDGQIVAASAIARDVTERKQAEETFRLAVEAAPAAMVMIDAQGSVVLVNSFAERLFGCSRDEIVGRSVETLLPPRFRQQHPTYRATFFAESAPRRMGAGRELFALRKDGSEVPVEIGLSPIRTDQGTFVLAAVTDITERKQTEIALRQNLEDMTRMQRMSTRLLRAEDFPVLLDEFLAAAIEITGADMGNIQLLEHGALKITSQRGFERPFLEFFDEVHTGQAACGSALQRGDRVIAEDVASSPLFAGTPARGVMLAAGALAVQSTPLVSRSGRIVGMFSTHYRQTPHRPSDRELRMLDILARQAADLIERDQIEQSERRARHEAETANRLKDEFLATVSHELRTPLNAVLGWAKMVSSKQVKGPRVGKVIETIERNAAALAVIIDDLLDVSRIIAGKLALASAPVDLIAVSQGAVDVVKPLATAKDIDLQFSAATTPEFVHGDAHRLQQVIGNLLTNAIKFTPNGGRVDVSVVRAGSQMEVIVRDTGQGIDPEFLPHVFERFRQADAGTTRQHGGLGLGLAIVKQLVELHRGTVHAASDGEGRGATFTVRLPVPTLNEGTQRWSVLAQQRSASSIVSRGPEAQRLDGVRVLVVDDNEDGRTLAAFLLTQSGASVKDVASVHEALQVLETERPDVLVSDIGLPDEDGYALIRQIRQQEASRGGFLPAIALTGYASARDRAQVLAAGFQGHVGKPVEPAELIAAIAAFAPARRRA